MHVAKYAEPGNLVLKHFRSSLSQEFWVAELNTALCFVTRKKKMKMLNIILNNIFKLKN